MHKCRKRPCGFPSHLSSPSIYAIYSSSDHSTMLSYTEASTIPEASGSRSTPGPTPGKATTGAETSTVEMPSTSPLRRATPAKGQASPIHTKTQPQAGPSTTPSRAAMARTLAERARTTPFTPRRRGASEQGGDVTECGKNLRARKSVNYKEIPPEPFKSGERTTAGKKDSDGMSARSSWRVLC